jgi:uncharacterized protein YdeI (YjbR/CyaY-like superfamily)
VKPENTYATLAFASQQEWEAWLDAHHADIPGVWLKIAKAGAGGRTITYAEALESALCYGWIDGQKGALDGQYWLQKFTPRRPKSVWSRINRDKAAALLAAGRMRPAGLRQVELAQADGRWDAAYESASTITVPEDFQAALDAHAEAKAFFATLDSTNRYAILRRIHMAKRPATRAAKIQNFVEMLSKRQKIYPGRGEQ